MQAYLSAAFSQTGQGTSKSLLLTLRYLFLCCDTTLPSNWVNVFFIMSQMLSFLTFVWCFH